MIEAVRYLNFKRYNDTTLDLSKRLTVLVGPNSSGKSSLIKGLLAFKQTYGDPSDHAGFIAQGQYVDIGNFVEYVKDHNIKRNVGFVFGIRGGIVGVSWTRQKQIFVEIFQENDPQTSHGRVQSYSIYIPSPSQEVDINNYIKSDNVISFTRMSKTDESFRINVNQAFFELLRHSYRNLLGDAVTFERVAKAFKGSIQAKRDNKRGMSILPERSGEGLFQFIYALERYVLSPIHSALFNALTERTFALASLREKPVRSMTLTDERQVVGPTGAHTAAVYHYLRQRAVKAGKKHSRIKDDYSRLDSWFQRLKLGNEIEINSWRDLIDLRTKSGRSAQSDSVVDVGVGFSQAAPILVQLAAMPDNTKLIVEQPELHLYPWSQTRLGEILCEESSRGKKRIVIETHSEHIIHGIQLHISNVRAGKMSGLRPSDVQIAYVSDESEITPIELDDYGEFRSNWPDGFFDQTLRVYRTLLENRSA